VPDSVDLDKYRAATIWCKRFQVNFGTAPLAPVAGESAPIVP
jgi:electron transfer DM13